MEIEAQPRLLGFCIGVPGHKNCGNRVTEDDVMAVVVPGLGPIGSCCQSLLFSGASWSSQVDLGRPSEQPMYKDPQRADSLVGAKKRRRHAKTVGILLPGSTVFTEPKPERPEHWRKYPKRNQAKQPWGTERP